MKPCVCLVVIPIFLWLGLMPAAGQSPAKIDAGYARVTGPCLFEFPRDHGAHPEYRTEWWYYTGNLADDAGRRFGFQLTFFRSRILPPGEVVTANHLRSAWRTPQIFAAHAAISDIEAGKHWFDERLVRGALEMAGVSRTAGVTRVFLRDWSAVFRDGLQLLSANTSDFSLDLQLVPLKPPVAHGDQGYSRKGTSPDRASCYYSFTRMETRGNLVVDGMPVEVAGLSWMDHEFSSAPLEDGIDGWDWFSLQFQDETELMIYRLRLKEGGVHAASSGTFVTREGHVRHLTAKMIDVTAREYWKSPNSKATYPVAWRIVIPGLDLDIKASAELKNQEMRTGRSTGVTYWEGSVSANGTRAGQPVEGRGYIEMTGYADRFSALRVKPDS